jgi:DNA-binding SARP family transcriptional activator
MSMEFRLLGEVEVLVDSGVVAIGHTRERMVLVALLMDLNRPVSVGELIDRVWGERLPQRPRAALYSYLSRLRRVMAALDGVSIRKQPSGYLLEADPMAVDLHRFGHLVGQARTSEDDALAADLFTRALALWRAQPLAEAETPWLVALREDLRRRRRAAELDRDDVLLRLGRHEEVLATASGRADEDCWDERRAGQLMLALYRCGRQADALAHYERLRARLAEDLGADPTPGLQRLHHQILTADPALEHPARRARPTVPRQLPMAPRSFTGRTAELAVLDDLLLSGAQHTVVVSAVSGGGGVGKTWLALHWAHRNAARFPDGQLYVNLRGFDPVDEPLSPATVIRGFLSSLGVTPAAIPGDLDAQAALYRSLVADQRILVVLDNARDTTQVTPLLPGSPTCTVLITSRHRLNGLTTTLGARSLILDVLDVPESRELMAACLGPSRVAAEPDVVAELLRHCKGLPLEG